MNAPLYMIELRPDPARLIHFLQGQGLNCYRDEDLGYGVHAWLAATFGLLAPKPYRLFGGNRALRLLGYTDRFPEALAEHARTFAAPLALAVFDLADLAQGKTMPSKWRTDRRLAFEVLVCPVTRKDDAEKDIFLRRVEATGQKEGLDRAVAYAEWLAGQVGPAADLDDVRLSGFRLVRMLRRTQRGDNGGRRAAPRITRSQALLTGSLTVKDGSAFVRVLARGIGRHRAFGYGMLLLRPAS